jgi:hypothetical protein
MRIEIALLLYNRPDHSQKVIESLIENKVPEIRAYLDYSDNPKVLENQAKILDYINSQKNIKINLYKHTEKQGLAKSIKFAMNHTFKEADAVILLEDDCVVRPGGIQFFKEGLVKFKDDKKVRSICGYLFPAEFMKKDGELLLLSRFCTWGWATWKKEWSEYKNDLRELVKEFEKNKIKIEDFAIDIARLAKSKDYLDNKVDIWSVNWILEHYLTGTLCLYPNESVIENIGFDGSGKNSEKTSEFNLNIKNNNTHNWDNVVYYVYNEEVLRQFMKKNGLKTYPYL